MKGESFRITLAFSRDDELTKPTEFVGGGELPDGSIRLATPSTGAAIYAFVDVCVRRNWSFPFDWPSFTERAREFVQKPEGIESASLDDLRRLLTVTIWQDRFGPGVIEEMAERGVFLRILDRMVVLASPSSFARS